jgi:putative ABC transport system ATP-binding protein
MIALKHIDKIYNDGKPNEFHALRGVSMEIPGDRVTVFKGPSGSGKTTLLSIIGCMVRPTAGRIFIDGRETTSLPEKFLAGIRRSTFGFVFQNFNLIKGITVLENTMLPAYPTGKKHRQVRSDAVVLLERLGIGGKAGQKVEHLSGGEQQRTAIARALINHPSIIIADEPTAHLDRALSVEFLDIIAELSSEGKTILMASHDPLVFNAGIVENVVEMQDGGVMGAEASS